MSRGRQLVKNGDSQLLPSLSLPASSSASASHQSGAQKCVPNSSEGKRNRLGKGSYILTLVWKFLSEQENWKAVDTKKCYQFPSVFTKACTQQLYYVADSSKLTQTCNDVHSAF